MPSTTNLAQLYQEYRHAMTALSYRLTGSWSEAEDLVQDVFAELQQNELLDDIRQPKSYLMRAVVNRSLNALKHPGCPGRRIPGHGCPNRSLSLSLQRNSTACCWKSKSLMHLWSCWSA